MKLRQRAAVAVTLLLIVVGSAMPRLACAAMDRQLLGRQTVRENIDLTLPLGGDADFFQSLTLFQQAHTQVELSQGYRMTAEEVEGRANEVMQELTQKWMDAPTPQVTPMLLTDQKDAQRSGVFWKCTWGQEKQGESTLWLDDRTGQMMAFRCRPEGNIQEYFTEDRISWETNRIVDYCRANYPVDEIQLIADDSKKSDGGYVLALTQEKGDMTTVAAAISIRVGAEGISFND